MFRPAVYETDPRTRQYIVPTRIVRTTGDVRGAENMLQARSPQISLERPDFWPPCVLSNKNGERAGILVDFGCELHGSARIYSWYVHPKTGDRVNLRLRFGESVSEAMTPYPEKGSTNDHANRDIALNVGFLSANETNETGYRFLNIELEDDDSSIELYMIQGVLITRDIPRLGSFVCNDARINDIYETSVYTAYLNMQEYLWDGIKRDRLVWCGDIYPSELTILSAFGADKILNKSLDLHSLITPPTKWMNGMPTYSLWWLLSHEILYMAGGNKTYLCRQHDYMKELAHNIADFIDENGAEKLPGGFLDWPNSENRTAIHAGQQALMAMAFEKTAKMMRAIGDEETAAFCDAQHARLISVHLPHGNSKQAASMLALAGIESAQQMNDEVIAPGGGHGYSTFLGYMTLAAKAEADDLCGALRDMREYWGAMLDLGATTFWEDFNLDWAKNAGRIDEIVPEGKADIHGDFGAYCYKNLRHSLCHAWASGPAPFLAKYVLGVDILEPGCKKIAVHPRLGDLEWAEGDYPTPYGSVHIRCEKTTNGLQTTVSAPNGVEIVEN